jgi:hypothetical protein
MGKIHDERMHLRAELEAPPALRRFGSGWISGVLGLVLGVAGFGLPGHPVPLGYVSQFKYPFQREPQKPVPGGTT